MDEKSELLFLLRKRELVVPLMWTGGLAALWH